MRLRGNIIIQVYKAVFKKKMSKLLELTITATPVSLNLGTHMILTDCPSDPAIKL
jgi:hypothetical protein